MNIHRHPIAFWWGEAGTRSYVSFLESACISSFIASSSRLRKLFPVLELSPSSSWMHICHVAESVYYVLLSSGGMWSSWCPHDRHIQSTKLTIEWVSRFISSKSLYTVILALPLSVFGLGRDMLWSLGGSRGPLNLVEIGLPSNVSLIWSSSSICTSKLISIGPDGAKSIVYEDVIHRIRHFYSSEYPTMIHFSNFGHATFHWEYVQMQ